MDSSTTGPKYAAIRTSDTETREQRVAMSGRYSDIAKGPRTPSTGSYTGSLGCTCGTIAWVSVYYISLSEGLADLLRLLVILADTWLHIATKTVTFTQLQRNIESPASHGFGLKESCTIGNNSYAYIGPLDGDNCTLNIPITNILLSNGLQSLEVLNNVSSLATVSTITSGQDYAYLAVPPSATLANEDWSAESFALQTQCRLASAECNLSGEYGATTPFNCSDAFHGDLTSDPKNFIWAFFTDDTMSDNVTGYGVENPFYFGMAGLVNPNIGESTVPGTVNPSHGGTAFVLLCNTTILQVTYDSVNGTISNFHGILSNATTVNIWQSVMAFTTVGMPNMKQAASLAAMGHSSQQFTDDMALSFSKTALAIGSQSVERRPPLAVQSRFSFLAATVPAAPLYALVGANMLVVFVGLILTIVALVTSKGEVKEVQGRLSIIGLVADRFEGKAARLAVKDLMSCSVSPKVEGLQESVSVALLKGALFTRLGMRSVSGRT